MSRPAFAVSRDEPGLTLRAELREFIESRVPVLRGSLDDHTSLIASGELDSVALFDLMLWIEGKLGHPVDPAAVALRDEWDSLERIAQYVEGRPNAAHPNKADAASRSAGRHRSQLQIVRYVPELKAAIANLQTALWSPDPSANQRYFEWKYQENPYGGDPHVYLAIAHGDVVGMRGFYPSRWEVGQAGASLELLVADDSAIRHGHRNRGLSTRIMNAALDDLRDRGPNDLLSLSGSPVTVASLLASGWQNVGLMNPLSRVQQASALRQAARSRMAAIPVVWRWVSSPFMYSSKERRPFDTLDALYGEIAVGGSARVQITGDARDADMASLIERLPYDGRIRHVRDEAYFSWRLRDPLSEYRFLYVGDDLLRGYLILKCRGAGRRTSSNVHIVDCEAVDADVRRALLEAAVESGAFPNLMIWSATLGPESTAELVRLGFAPVSSQRSTLRQSRVLARTASEGLFASAARQNGRSPLDIDSWDMRMLYSMAG